MAGAPLDPESRAGGGASKGKQLNSCVAVESGDGNDAVLDGRRRPGSDRKGAGQLKDHAQNHGLLVGDGARGDAGSPCVGDIIW
jgi:hypothetical protein